MLHLAVSNIVKKDQAFLSSNVEQPLNSLKSKETFLTK